METRETPRNTDRKHGFKRLLAQCMAAALIKSVRNRRGKDATTVTQETFRNMAERLGRESLEEE